MKSFKDSQGRFRTQSLFWEKNKVALRDEYPPIYTLKDEDYKDYKSARLIYLAQRDPTEYKAAIALFGSWAHWNHMLESCKWFVEHLEEWRSELEVLLRSEAIKGIVDDSESDSKSNVTSCKWLADKGWEKSDTRGRPSKKAVEKEAKIQGRIAEELDEDIARMEQVH